MKSRAQPPLVVDLVTAIDIEQLNARPEADGVARDHPLVDVGKRLPLVVKTRQLGLHQFLALLGGIVLGVLAEVAVRRRFGELTRQLHLELTLQRLDLVFQFLEEFVSY